MGGIKRLSVAVVVDGKQSRSTEQRRQCHQPRVEAWSPRSSRSSEDIVASAVGIDKKRGDTLEIKNMEFTHEDFEEATRMHRRERAQALHSEHRHLWL